MYICRGIVPAVACDWGKSYIGISDIVRAKSIATDGADDNVHVDPMENIIRGRSNHNKHTNTPTNSPNNPMVASNLAAQPPKTIVANTFEISQANNNNGAIAHTTLFP